MILSYLKKFFDTLLPTYKQRKQYKPHFKRTGHIGHDIRKLRAAIRRTENEMNDIESKYSFPRDCCPSCACGAYWNYLADKVNRQRWWLAHLLTKKGGAASEEAQDILKELGRVPEVYRKK